MTRTEYFGCCDCLQNEVRVYIVGVRGSRKQHSYPLGEEQDLLRHGYAISNAGLSMLMRRGCLSEESKNGEEGKDNKEDVSKRYKKVEYIQKTTKKCSQKLVHCLRPHSCDIAFALIIHAIQPLRPACACA